MAEQQAVGFKHRRVELPEQLPSRLGDASENHPPVFRLTAAGNQAASFKPVQKPCNIGVSADHAISDLAASEALGRPPEDPQHVVLGRGYLGCSEHRLEPPGQLIGRDRERDEDLFLEYAGAAPGIGVGSHEIDYSRYNNCIQSKGSSSPEETCPPKNERAGGSAES
jgi:hypothetical protein